ncbi:MAG: FMN-binding negative transcriptional regulator [Alphaproteobacteria bacterium]|nr:FMN-binding negative transcriptional regulator [Alphaproteobacteria bacterium]
MVYLPKHFAETRRDSLSDIISRYSFATVVTHGGNGLIASQLPFLYEPAEGPHGTLLCHLARPNPQVEDLRSGGEALVIFAGPHAYVSPSWYEVHPAVPTWNYASVHAYGTPRAIEEPAALVALVDRLSRVYESGRAKPWRLADQPEAYIAGMVRGIIGFSIAVSRIEGKFKLSQNRGAADRRRVVAALREEADPSATEVAELMAAREEGGRGPD